MSFLSMFFIVALVILILGIIIVCIIKNNTLFAVMSDLIGLAIGSSFMICIIISVITDSDYFAKDYLTDVGKVINDKEIIEVQANDGLLQDSAIITYKDSNGNPVIYNTTLPWYCDIEVKQSKKTYIKIDSSHNTFYVYTNTLKESGGIYTSKK